ncbi:transposable element Tcb1 transposase [Trichonephila clavipes]|nr:transposable element Tcb1 transposase [Trichonephila clavipes]
MPKLWMWRPVELPSIVTSGNLMELIRTVACKVPKSNANDRRTSSHDEFCGPLSAYVRQVALETTTTEKQRSVFDQVSDFDRGRIWAYRDFGLSVRKIGSRVGRNQTTVMRMCDRWMQEVSARIIQRRLQQSGLSARLPLLGLPLTQNNRRLHRQWRDKRRTWVVEWNEVVFTDESRICLQRHGGRIRV